MALIVLVALEARLRFFEDIGADFLFPAPAARTAEKVPGSGRSLEDIAAEIASCRKCPLASGRTRAVPGEGRPEADLMFVGEGPGHDEDVQGRPFVGRAGQLLTRIIAAMGFDRSDVFIANIVKCRPPDNRPPQKDEADACLPYLLEQIAAVGPKVIVTLGKTATDVFVPSRQGMTERRGRFETWRGIAVMPTFHPSYLVRNEGNKELKRMVWEDMKQVLAALAKT
ncbi:MAG: uracil-DNA glycosylase [Candidatus Aminicenantes bacterium]|nr:uracil-DNA glycosylase [Candidatus Aminicenantes bacterium]